MNGMLLAAGRGQRMEPLSSFVAKPALEVLGQPLLASALQGLAEHCDTLVVNLHRHPRQIASAVRQVLPRRRVHFSWEPELLGGAGGLAMARRFLGPGPLLAANADTLSTLDLAPLLAAPDPETITLGLVPHPDPATWSAVQLAAEGHVTAILPPGAPPAGNLFLFTGFQLLGATVMAAGLPPPPAELAPVWRRLMTSGRLRGVRLAGGWREAGDPEAYRQLVIALSPPAGWCHPCAAVASDARLACSAVGAACVVGPGATLTETVVTAGARVGAGAHLQRCIVAGALEVPRGMHAEGELLLPHGRFPLPAGRAPGHPSPSRPLA